MSRERMATVGDEFETDPCHFCRQNVPHENAHWLADDILLWVICNDCMAKPDIKTAVDRYEAAVRREDAYREDLRAVWQRRHKKLPGEE